MVNIDYIMNLIDWNSSIENQNKGIKLAKDVKCINVFLQPCDNKYNKNVWDNCAKIIAKRCDKELEPYLHELFEWLMDMNWPGADSIFERLKVYNNDKWFNCILKKCINEAQLLHEYIWLETLIEIGKFHGLDYTENESDIDYIMYLLNCDSDQNEQNKGIELAKRIKNLSVLFQPIESKSLCENCAKVIASKKDEDLKPYLMLMFNWLQDMNWPGAEIIYDRLKAMPEQFIELDYKMSLDIANETDNYSWKLALEDFKNNK